MSARRPRVSVITIFLNADRFLDEAIASVFGQSFAEWELLLVDDGSTDGSAAIARSWVERDPSRVRYLAHPGHINRGMSASRNLGISEAAGDLVAFLDADDVWLAPKLEKHVALLDEWPEAGMVYGATEYWHSWNGDAGGRPRDYYGPNGVPPETLVQPPRLLNLWLRNGATVPGMCSLVVRRSTVDEVGGFNDEFRGQYEDQVFYMKVALTTPVFVTANGWARYRQHPASSCAVTQAAGQAYSVRLRFLQWLERHLTEQDTQDEELWRRVRRRLRLAEVGAAHPYRPRVPPTAL